MPLTSRERMRRFLAGEPVDRIPNGLGGTETTGLHLLAYENLKHILGVPDAGTRMTTFMTTALVEPDVLRAMDGDLILLGSKLCPAAFWGPAASDAWKTETFWGRPLQVARQWEFRHAADGAIWWGENWKCPPGGIYFDPVPTTTMAQTILSTERPNPDDYHPPHDIPDERLRALEEAARWLHVNTDYCIVAGEMITDLQLKPGGVQGWWMRLVEEPQAAHDFLAKAAEAGLSQLRLIDQAIGRYAAMMQIADDIGDRRGVTIGPDLWREIYRPHYMTLFQGWHQLTNMKLVLHCCGSIYDILDDLIACGVEVFNPVQISAQDMEPESLVARFGRRVVFYGGVFDAVQTPPSTPAEVVYETVKRNLLTFSRGGPCIFAGVHNIPGDTPVEHLRAILQAYQDCRDLSMLPSVSDIGV